MNQAGAMDREQSEAMSQGMAEKTTHSAPQEINQQEKKQE
jgi:hypothetical protein